MLSQGIPIAYFLIGFSTDASRFFLFWFTCFMLAMVGISLAILLAVALPNFEVVSILVGVSQVSVFCVSALFSDRERRTRMVHGLCLL